MYGNFTRDSYRRRDNFTSVRLLQGALVTDADVNEAADIAQHQLRAFAADVIGPHGGPAANLGFAIAGNGSGNLSIGAGHYYVEGILLELDAATSYLAQPGLRGQQPLGDGSYLVFLHVFERIVTAIERPRIRDVALGDADTSHRTELVWQVKARVVENAGDLVDDWGARLLHDVTYRVRPRMRARVRPEQPSQDPCVIAPDSRYRGLENQLYRVEVHDGGVAGQATFKFSRDNGAVVFPIRDAATMTLGSLGRDDRLSLHQGDHVELVDDTLVLDDVEEPGGGQSRPLRVVQEIDPDTGRVVLSGEPAEGVSERAFLRRWDTAHNDTGTTQAPAPIVEDHWIELEDGVQIRFEPRDAVYRTGDYWLVPARVATGDVVWPGSTFLLPRGPAHHYAPLAYVSMYNGVPEGNVIDARRKFAALAA